MRQEKGDIMSFDCQETLQIAKEFVKEVEKKNITLLKSKIEFEQWFLNGDVNDR